MEQTIKGPSITAKRRKPPSPVRSYWYLNVGLVVLAAGAVAGKVPESD